MKKSYEYAKENYVSLVSLLYLIKGVDAKKFVGIDIPGFCTIMDTSTIYSLSNLPMGFKYNLSLEPDTKPLWFFKHKDETYHYNDLNSFMGIARKWEFSLKTTKIIINNEFKTIAEEIDKIGWHSIATEAS